MSIDLLSSRRGCHARHLGHRQGREGHADDDDEIHPYCARRTTVRKRNEQANSRKDPSVSKQQRISEDRKKPKVAPQLLLFAQPLHVMLVVGRGALRLAGVLFDRLRDEALPLVASLPYGFISYACPGGPKEFSCLNGGRVAMVGNNRGLVVEQ